jgi:hypothetical protein
MKGRSWTKVEGRGWEVEIAISVYGRRTGTSDAEGGADEGGLLKPVAGEMTDGG